MLLQATSTPPRPHKSSDTGPRPRDSGDATGCAALHPEAGTFLMITAAKVHQQLYQGKGKGRISSPAEGDGFPGL